jgi:hypothetical protein
MTEPTLQFNLDGEWVDLPPVDCRIDTRTPPDYTVAEQALMWEVAKEFVEAEGCTFSSISVETIRGIGTSYIKVRKK